jgi:hypothetical protein
MYTGGEGERESSIYVRGEPHICFFEHLECVYVCVCVCVYTYIYIYIYRERERERERERPDRDADATHLLL